MSDLPLFVFGTLRRGEENHHVLEGRYDRWLPGRLFGFRRILGAHGYPAAVPALGDSIEGELFFLAPATAADTLRRCDDLEDLPPGQLAGAFYQRAKVRVETSHGTVLAWAYIDPATPVDGESQALVN